MKKACLGFLTLFTVLFAGTLVYGQKNTVEDKIAEVYAGYVNNLNPDQLSWIKKELSRSEVKKETYSKDEEYPLLSSVPLLNKYNPQIAKDDFSKPMEINPIKYQISFMESKDQVFRIDGTDYVLVVKAKQ